MTVETTCPSMLSWPDAFAIVGVCFVIALVYGINIWRETFTDDCDCGDDE